MDFFIHTTKASDSAKLKKLQDVTSWLDSASTGR